MVFLFIFFVGINIHPGPLLKIHHLNSSFVWFLLHKLKSGKLLTSHGQQVVLKCRTWSSSSSIFTWTKIKGRKEERDRWLILNLSSEETYLPRAANATQEVGNVTMVTGSLMCYKRMQDARAYSLWLYHVSLLSLSFCLRNWLSSVSLFTLAPSWGWCLWFWVKLHSCPPQDELYSHWLFF